MPYRIGSVKIGSHPHFVGAMCIICWSLYLGSADAQSAASIDVENALLKTIEATTVSAEVAGKIDRLAIVEGSTVNAGQEVGKVRDQAVRFQVEQSRIAMAVARKKQVSDIDLQLAQKKAAVARNELERAETANARIENTYPPKEIDRLRLVSESADLEIQRAEHEQELRELDVMIAENEYRQASELLSRHRIASPVDGVVVAMEHRVGEWVEPGTELFKIVKIDRLRIEGFINAASITEQLVDQSADVVVLKANEERRLTGKVVFVSPEANPVNGQVRVYLEIDNSQGEFRPGMRVRASIVQQEP
jgi:RND family efflux transporter MFP subunit